MAEIHGLLERFFERAASMRVAVVGETIIDAFVPVDYAGQSMKSFCSVLALRGEVAEQQGGAAAIAGHLRDFVAAVEMRTNTGREIVKTRYVDRHDGKKHIEINRFDTHEFPGIEVDTGDHDAVLVADFGHGYCDRLVINDGFHLMCQTNSDNFGFNRVSKWKHQHKRSVTLDLREGSLQLNRKLEPDEASVRELHGYELHADHLFMTCGAEGALYTDGEVFLRQAAVPSQVVDTIGAGDCFYAFAALGSAMGWPPGEIMSVAALAASLATTWLCNERVVTRQGLIEHADRQLS
jgi:bifunctional ADP-heptose synthase (sugar kinase/adenylyltransferase)